MNNKNKMEGLINDYLAGNLPPNLQKEFENYIEENEDFRQEVALYQNINAMVLDKNTPKLKALLRKIESDLAKQNPETTQKTTKRISLKRALSIAASFLLLLATLAYLLLMPPNPEKLYAQMVNQHQDVRLALTHKNANDPINTIDLEKAYQIRDYKKTLRLAESYLENQNDFSVLLVKGICQLELNRFEEALLTFDLLSKSDALIAPKGQWYKAMTYLKNENIEDCQKILQQIIAEKSYNYKKATLLLNEF